MRSENFEFAQPNGAIVQRGEKPFVEGLSLWLRRFTWPAAELDRCLDPRAGQLSFVRKAQAGQAETQQRDGAVLGQREDRGGVGFIVILLKVSAAANEVPSDAKQMPVDASHVMIDKIVVGTFVVRVIETEGLQSRFKVPIDLPQEIGR